MFGIKAESCVNDIIVDLEYAIMAVKKLWSRKDQDEIECECDVCKLSPLFKNIFKKNYWKII